ncbi:XisI protein [Merismopedia glauca]|uniref:XisI protein n=1 Tax=Merismopedia glauca CCAP 1448/3 TaxID=1296344 RepID=A0A2T1C432_9CYAN|nr:XisI protein [Merismopedia glauca]PSB02984.1 XisI protein [Merismopedia glauca CCAP 1448/3]
MERVDYPTLIQTILAKYADRPPEEDVEIQLIFDTARNRYQMLFVGWEDAKRIYSCVVHVDIKGNKFWIQRDRTEVGIANLLVEAGVPKTDIVLAFYAPYKRVYTEFAAG